MERFPGDPQNRFERARAGGYFRLAWRKRKTGLSSREWRTIPKAILVSLSTAIMHSAGSLAPVSAQPVA